MGRSRDAEAVANLPPGFRFHPTDEELVVHYLCRRAAQQHFPVPIIAELDLYKHNPWDLPDRALFGNREWYFFTPRDRKYPNGSRPNRAAGRGYWKATGADKSVPTGSYRPVGIKKALVFYDGKAPKGTKTDWIMHEYRLVDTSRASKKNNGSLRLDDWVLCRLYNKRNGWREMQKEAEESHDTWSESFRSPESDIELPDLDDLVHGGMDQNQISDAAQIPVAPPLASKEEYDWFSDLNLDDLHNPIGPLRSTLSFNFSTPECYFTSNFSSPKPT